MSLVLMETKSIGKVQLATINLEYEVIRTPGRKSLRLKVIEIGKVEIRCAKSIKWDTINDFLLRREDWIKRKIAELTQSTYIRYPVLKNDATIFYLGQPIVVKILRENQKFYNIVLDNSTLIVIVPEKALDQNITKKIIEFYKATLTNLLWNWTTKLDKKLVPTKIIIRNYRSKWGSTNSKRHIYFNSYLLMLPIHLIEYVFFHEISHLLEMNHSKRYKQILASFLPNYPLLKSQLKKYRLKG